MKRRERIVNALVQELEILKADMAVSGFPIQVATVQKSFINWTNLNAQNAFPALLVAYPRRGRVRDADLIGFSDEGMQIFVTAVLKELSVENDIVAQASNIHFSIGRIINANPTLGIQGVEPDETGIISWEVRQDDDIPSNQEVVDFVIQLVHRYGVGEDV